MIEREFWKGKRVFITGHTGFKGSWISLWLNSLDAKVKGYALNPPTSPSLFNEARLDEIIESEIGDIRNQKNLLKSMVAFNPDILIHMAAQPLVRESYDQPVETYDVNVLGTVKVLEVARSCSNLKSIICVTSDKCYENNGIDKSYKEGDPMGGHDPYSSSKGCSELVVSSYRHSFFNQNSIGIASVRAGNVIGGGDWANNRLIPDILRSFAKNNAVIIRNPNAIRPWQHVLEPLAGYIILAQKLYEDQASYSQAWNFGPYEKDSKPVSWILDQMISMWPNSRWILNDEKGPYEAELLKLDIQKSISKIGWRPIWSLELSLKKIIKWYKSWLNQEDMKAVCIAEIEDYMSEMTEKIK
tara:strand:+ start:59 stop:1129 length:1071 start_codon:yes stop_codon:yes gene_type:complete